MVTNGQQDSVQAVESSDTINSLSNEELTDQATRYLGRVSRYLKRLEDITRELRCREDRQAARIFKPEIIYVRKLDLIMHPDNRLVWLGKTYVLGPVVGNLMRQIVRRYPDAISVKDLTLLLYEVYTPHTQAKTSANLCELKEKFPTLIERPARAFYRLNDAPTT